MHLILDAVTDGVKRVPISTLCAETFKAKALNPVLRAAGSPELGTPGLSA